MKMMRMFIESFRTSLMIKRMPLLTMRLKKLQKSLIIKKILKMPRLKNLHQQKQSKTRKILQRQKKFQKRLMIKKKLTKPKWLRDLHC